MDVSIQANVHKRHVSDAQLLFLFEGEVMRMEAMVAAVEDARHRMLLARIIKLTLTTPNCMELSLVFKHQGIHIIVCIGMSYFSSHLSCAHNIHFTLNFQLETRVNSLSISILVP